MVMFREDEERIKAMERAEREARRGPVMRWVRRLVKITIIGAVLLFIGLTILMRMAEESAYLQQGVLDYMEQVSGMNAEVGLFGDIKIFPVIMLGMEDVRMAWPGQDDIEISIGQFKYAAGFWDTMFSRDRVKVMALHNAQFSASALKAERSLYIEYAGVSPLGYNGDAPGFSMKGRWGDEAFEAMVEMDLRDKNGRIVNYIMYKDSPFHVKLGDLEASGKIRTSALSGVWVTLHSLSDTTYPLEITGTVNYGKKWGDYHLNFDIAAEKTHLEGKFTFNPDITKGTVTGSNLQAEDIKSLIGLTMRIAHIVVPDIMAQAQMPVTEEEGVSQIAITYDIENINLQDQAFGAVKGKIGEVAPQLRNVLDCLSESVLQQAVQKPDIESAALAAIQADYICTPEETYLSGSDVKDRQE